MFLKESYTTIHEAECTPSGKDPFGMISGGKIKLTAPLLEVDQHRLADVNGMYANPRFKMTPKHYNFGKFCTSATLDFELRLDGNESLFWLLLGGERNVNWMGPTPADLENLPSRVEGFILRRKHEPDLATYGQVFERVGCCGIIENDWARNDHDACFQLLKAIDCSANQTVIIV